MATFAIPAPQLGASPAPMSKASMRTALVKMADGAPSPGKECKRGSYTLTRPRFTYPRLARVAEAPSGCRSSIGYRVWRSVYNARRRRGRGPIKSGEKQTRVNMADIRPRKCVRPYGVGTKDVKKRATSCDRRSDGAFGTSLKGVRHSRESSALRVSIRPYPSGSRTSPPWLSPRWRSQENAAPPRNIARTGGFQSPANPTQRGAVWGQNASSVPIIYKAHMKEVPPWKAPARRCGI